MGRPRGRLNVEVALEIYYSMPEIGNAEIAEIFGLSKKSTVAIAARKRAAREFMIKNDMKSWDPASVKTKAAYEAWGIDVDELEKSFKALQRLKKLKVNEKPPVGKIPTEANKKYFV